MAEKLKAMYVLTLVVAYEAFPDREAISELISSATSYGRLDKAELELPPKTEKIDVSGWAD